MKGEFEIIIRKYRLNIFKVLEILVNVENVYEVIKNFGDDEFVIVNSINY